jgi:hypothetical protein
MNMKYREILESNMFWKHKSKWIVFSVKDMPTEFLEINRHILGKQLH